MSHGGILRFDAGAVSLKDNTTDFKLWAGETPHFPHLRLRTNPFPLTGDWTCSFVYSYNKGGTNMNSAGVSLYRADHSRLLYLQKNGEGQSLTLNDQVVWAKDDLPGKHQVSLKKRGDLVTVSLDGLPIASAKMGPPPVTVELGGEAEPHSSNWCNFDFHYLAITADQVSSQTGLEGITFTDDFSSPSRSSQLWEIVSNGGQAYITGTSLRLESNGKGFPVVQTMTNPFPAAGDWIATFDYRYSSIGNYGTELSLLPSIGDFVARVHQDVHNQLIQVNGMSLLSFPANTDWHKIMFEGRAGRIIVTLDGKVVGEELVSVRPTRIMFGGGLMDNVWDWNNLEIRSVTVTTSSQTVLSSSLIKTTTPTSLSSAQISQAHQDIPAKRGVPTPRPVAVDKAIPVRIKKALVVARTVHSRKINHLSKKLVTVKLPKFKQTPDHMVTSALKYDIIDLGVLPGDIASEAYDINNTGVVVGKSVTSYHDDLMTIGHAFTWFGGMMTDLGTLDGYTSTQAWKINDGGYIVGAADNLADSSRLVDEGAANALDVMHGFFWAFGKMYDLNMLHTGTVADADGINNRRMIVGAIGFPIGHDGQLREHGFLWKNDHMTDLGIVPGYSDSKVVAINDSDWMVWQCKYFNEQALPPTFVERSFLSVNGRLIELPRLPGYTNTSAARINSTGAVVGTCRGPGMMPRATLWAGEKVTPLGGLPNGESSAATSLNDWGDVVGSAGDGENWHAVLWTRRGIYDLNASVPKEGWVLTDANGINNLGQPLGRAFMRVKSERFC